MILISSFFSLKGLSRSVLIAFLVLLSFSLSGQTETSTSSNPLIEKARLFLKREQYDSAVLYFEKGIEEAKRVQKDIDLAFVKAELARTLVSEGDFDRVNLLSQEVLNESNSSDAAKILTYQNLGAVAAISKGDFKEALKYNHKALSLSSKVFGKSGQKPSLPFDQYRRSLQILAYFHRDSRTFDSAQYYFEKTIILAEKKIPFEAHILAFDKLNLASLYLAQGKFAEGRIHLLKTEELIKTLPLESQEEFDITAKYYNRIGGYYSRLAFRDSSITVALKEEAIYRKSPYVDSVSFARVLSNIAIGYLNKQNFTKAQEYERQAFAIKKRILDPDHFSMATSYKILAGLLIEDSHSTDEALEYFEEALRITRKRWGDQSPRTVGAMQLLAYGYDTAEENEKALNLLLETLEIQLEVEGLQVLATAEMYSQIAGTLRDLGRFDESIEYYKKYFEVSENIVQADMRVTNLLASFGFGKAYLFIGDYTSAEKHLKVAQEAIISLAGEDEPTLARVYNKLSQLYRAQNLLAKATELNEKAFLLNNHDKTIFKQDTVPLNWRAIYQTDFVESHLIKTQILFNQLFEPSSEVSLEDAWKSLKITEQITNELLIKESNSSRVIAMQQFNNLLYASAIDALWKYDSLAQDNKNTTRMWELSERSKGIQQKLKEQRRQLSSMGVMSSKIIEDRSKINTQIDRYKSMILEGNNADSIRSKLFQLSQERKAYEAKVKKEYPKDYELVYSDQGIKADQIISQLNTDQTIIDYFISNDQLFAFVISSEGVSVHLLSTTKAIYELITSFNQGLTKENSSSYASAAWHLYQAVIQPLEKQIKGTQLIIVPNKGLWNINFDLLLTQNTSSEDFRTYDYLLKKYVISYAYSSSLLFKDRANTHSGSKMLAFAFNEDSEESSDFENFRDAPKDKLPGTATEVRNLSKTVTGDFYYGKEANETLFKKVAPDYAVIHLALHGEVDEKDSDRSKLYFTQSDEATSDDNVLHTFELYNMNLQAELAVLSACNTGVGDISSGEGIMSLGRGFQYAGVNSVLLSQWPVSDAIAPVIMSSFYTHLKAGKNKAEALRLAKLEFLESANNLNANPYYWGSFFILGNPDPVDLNDRNNLWLWVVGGLVLLILVVARKRMTGRKA